MVTLWNLALYTGFWRVFAADAIWVSDTLSLLLSVRCDE